MYSKIARNISSGSYGVCVQVEFYIFILTHKLHLNASSASRKSLKRISSLANTELNQSKHGFALMLVFVYFLDIVTCTGMQIICLISFRT